MRRPQASDILLKALGLLLLTAAVLKAHELLTVPLLGKDLWSWRPFLIFQVEFELALGIWLLSGVAKPLAWLVATGCFGLFCCVTLYKGLTGAASCGCFGRVHVNPWITLMAIDLPAMVALLAFRPVDVFVRLRCSWLLSLRVTSLSLRALRKGAWRSRVHAVLLRPMAPIASARALMTECLVIVIAGVSTPVLALNKPAMATSRYEVLEPETWVGKELSILKHIDIGEQLKTGNWLVVLYHYDCPDCRKEIPKYEDIAREFEGNEEILGVALVEVPPFGPGAALRQSQCRRGSMNLSKQWFVATPVTVFVTDGITEGVWTEKTPSVDTVLVLLALGSKGEKAAQKARAEARLRL